MFAFLTPRWRFFLLMARRVAWRARLGAQFNYLRFRVSLGRIRKLGPDRLRYTPPDVSIWVTQRCNKACEFCQYRDGLNRLSAESDITWSRFQAILDHSLVRNALRICLYGGEPFLHAELFKMLREARRRGHLVTTITNGLLIERRVRELLADKPDLLTISYYPEDWEGRDNQVVQQVAQAMPVKINYVYSKGRLGGIRKAFEFAASVGARSIWLENLYPKESNSDEPAVANDPELLSLRAELCETYGDDLPIFWLLPQSTDGQAVKTTTVCREFWSRLMIDTAGRISPCCVWPCNTYEGNALEDNNIWNSDRLVLARAKMRTDCPPPECSGCDWLYNESPLDI